MNELGEITDKIVQLLQYDPVSPLIFSSGLFLFLFGGFTFFYQFMRREVMLRIVYVTLFSLYFYYKTSGFFFLLLFQITKLAFEFSFVDSGPVGIKKTQAVEQDQLVFIIQGAR